MRGSEVSGEGVKYRPDIDGLRAIAVLSVVLYHFGIGGLQGGFVGVDVFFVISGYLITGIIHSELQRGEFTLARFYERRARRIFPALFVVLLATMVAGLWILLPSDLARLGQSSVATILFVSNLQYFRESGYFDSSSEFNPLLHTWSLGVEEQFYLGLPLLLMVVWKFWPRGLGRVLAACAILSFVACVAVQPIVAKAASSCRRSVRGSCCLARCWGSARSRASKEKRCAMESPWLRSPPCWAQWHSCSPASIFPAGRPPCR